MSRKKFILTVIKHSCLTEGVTCKTSRPANPPNDAVMDILSAVHCYRESKCKFILFLNKDGGYKKFAHMSQFFSCFLI